MESIFRNLMNPRILKNPSRINKERSTYRRIIVKMLKANYKEKILKAAREKCLITYKGILIMLTADFSQETLGARR